MKDILILGGREKRVINPAHTHPLEFDSTFFDNKCIICQKEDSYHNYTCHACGFILCVSCVRKPFVVDPKRSHEHPLSLVPRKSLIFTCDACGVGDLRSPLCLCIPCCFTIHRDCIDLPRVICINRHEQHRISLVVPLGYGEWKCGVCRKKVDREYGAYSCSTCPTYVVHSRCTIREDVWDGIELEGVPEEDPEEIMPFKVVEEGVIRNFGHDHNLRLILLEADDHVYYQGKQCNVCILPIYADPSYVCSHDECDFILHQVCANFPKKKRHACHAQRLTLSTMGSNSFTLCSCCEQIGTGFAYEAEYFRIDVHCALILDGYLHKSHPQSALVMKNGFSVCTSCNKEVYRTLSCAECEDFVLCFRCVTLPAAVKHKYDQHPLTLCYGEKPNGNYWCEICEEKTDPHKWFYKCEECSSTFHINCVLENFPYLRHGFTYTRDDLQLEIFPNNYMTRQYCRSCSSRCEGPIAVKSNECFTCVDCVVKVMIYVSY